MTSEDGRRNPARPLIGVGTVVWHDDKVLLIQRGKAPEKGKWSLPGGAQELGETVRQTVRREVHEETGVEIEDPVLLDVVDMISPAASEHNARPLYHYTLIDFVARAKTTALTPGDDAADAKWVPFGEIDAYGLWDKTLEIIHKSRAFLSAAPHPAE